MRTLNDMIFASVRSGSRRSSPSSSRWSWTISATGVTPPLPANDDTPATKPPREPTQEARRNIGALPKHLPRANR